jgi:hypothetical protein
MGRITITWELAADQRKIPPSLLARADELIE